jgi:hypothetical protein
VEANSPPHPIEAVAREAYAHGWARTPGPMTERVHAGCEAAVAYAVDNCNDPEILEVTLQLGSLEGVWAWVYQRRAQLIADHLAAIREAWAKMLPGLDTGTLVTTVRRQSGMWEADHTPTTSLTDITAAARRWLYGITTDEHYPAFKTTVDDALRSAAAEGHASALAVAAEQRPTEKHVHIGDIWFDFDLAFDHAYAVLDSEGWPSAPWIDRVLQGGAADAGHLLADLIADETPYQEMVGALTDLVGASRSLGLFIDMAMSMSLNQGAVDLYASEGLRSYDVLTAGDGRVCPSCLDAETGNPHPVTDPSPVSLHPLCRCAVAATEPLNPSSYRQYLPEGGFE